MSVQTFSRNRDGNTRLSPNFKVVEFASRDGSDKILIDTRLVDVLQRIRDWTGQPVNIVSGFRSPAHNATIPGAANNSFHIHGQAADITIRGLSPADIARWAETALAAANIPGGIIVYDNFCHVDVRPTRFRGVNSNSRLTSNNGWTPMPTPTPPASVAPSQQTPNASVARMVWDSLMNELQNAIHTAAMMGNLHAESGMRPNALERTAWSRLGMNDETYTAAVDNGTITREQFIRDRAGYGLSQWTFHSRKAGLYDLAKSTGRSIANVEMQIEFLLQEMRTYGNVLRQLRETTTIRQASDIILLRFMKPANQGESEQLRRAGYAQTQFDRFTGETAPDDSLRSVSFNVQITGVPLNVRIGPGTNYKEIMQIKQTIIVTVIAEATGQGGDGVWYMMIEGESGAQSGWISRMHTKPI